MLAAALVCLHYRQDMSKGHCAHHRVRGVLMLCAAAAAPWIIAAADCGGIVLYGTKHEPCSGEWGLRVANANQHLCWMVAERVWRFNSCHIPCHPFMLSLCHVLRGLSACLYLQAISWYHHFQHQSLFEQALVYWVAPFAGALLGGLVYRCVCLCVCMCRVCVSVCVCVCVWKGQGLSLGCCGRSTIIRHKGINRASSGLA